MMREWSARRYQWSSMYWSQEKSECFWWTWRACILLIMYVCLWYVYNICIWSVCDIIICLTFFWYPYDAQMLVIYLRCVCTCDLIKHVLVVWTCLWCDHGLLVCLWCVCVNVCVCVCVCVCVVFVLYLRVDILVLWFTVYECLWYVCDVCVYDLFMVCSCGWCVRNLLVVCCDVPVLVMWSWLCLWCDRDSSFLVLTCVLMTCECGWYVCDMRVFVL